MCMASARGTKDLSVLRRVWRRGWDSNPRGPMDHRLSSALFPGLSSAMCRSAPYQISYIAVV